ncbi:MAG: NAD(P)H-hydrate epimerase, partial [Deltaproteobacteria bacterium]
MREIDRRAISEMGLPELLLMEHAALGVVQSLKKRFQETFNQTRGVILAGTGNNGGDALAVARIIDSLGLKNLFVALIGSDKNLSSSAKTQIEILGRLGVPVFRSKRIDR